MILARTARLLTLCLAVTLAPAPSGFPGLSGLVGVSDASAQWRGEGSGRPAPPSYRPPPGGGGHANRPPPAGGPGYRPPPGGGRPPGYRPPPGGHAGYRPPPPGRPGYRPPPPGGWGRPGYRPPPAVGWGPPPVPRAGWGYYRAGWPPPPAGYYYDNTGALIAAGMIGLAAGALAGAALSQPAALPPAQQVITSDQIAACARRYRSYDARTGTYLGNDGYRHPCP